MLVMGGANVWQDTRKYSLHIMDEGEPDFDFPGASPVVHVAAVRHSNVLPSRCSPPECDPKVKIESTGEEDFALCLRETQSMVLHIRVKRSRASTGTAILRVMFRFPTMSTPGRTYPSRPIPPSNSGGGGGCLCAVLALTRV